MSKWVLCIPVMNAGKYADVLIDSILRQNQKVNSLIVIDSSSNDGTRERFINYGALVHCIKPEKFNHGSTRNYFLKLDQEAEFFVFITQDVAFADDDSLDILLKSFEDSTIGAAFGRQLPRQGSRPIEAHARIFNYPPQSCMKGLSDAPQLGIKTAFISNSFAAYRRSALEAVGGFPSDVILSEDTYVSAKMLLAGWKIAYCAEARVYHSHGYSYLDEFRRYFDTGVFYGREAWISNSFGGAKREGFRFVSSELKFLWPRYFYLIPSAFVRNFLKFTAFRLGKFEFRLPLWLKMYLSMNKNFWLVESRRRRCPLIGGANGKRGS